MKLIILFAPRAKGEIERYGSPFLSLGYLAASALLDGHEVKIVDAHTFNLSVEQTVEEIIKSSPDAVAITANTHNRFSAIAVAERVKVSRPGIKIIVGGPHFGLTAVDALAVVPAIDYVITGEGELTLRELLKTNFVQSALAGVLGLTYRDASGRITANPPRPYIQNLDELPMPAWQLFELDKYSGGKPIEPSGLKTIGIVSSRGCPNSCIFCSSIALHQGKLRMRSPKNFVDEIQHLHGQYGYRAFNFWDDTFTIVRQHAVEICEEIIRRQLKIYWYSSCRVNTVDFELLSLMKRAGCVRVNFGIESGSPRMLKIIKKGITMEQARQAIAAAVRAGLEVTLNFLLVYPYETWDDIALTADAIKEFKAMENVSPSYSFIIIYPGTELEQIAKKEGIMPADFSWNSPYANTKQSLAGEDPSVFYFEWPGLPFEEVKAYIINRLSTKKEFWRRLAIKIRKIKNPADFKVLAVLAFNYLKCRLKIKSKRDWL